ncbi:MULTISPECIES: stage III sporulation protein AF [Bacillus]|uniref:stage III sporulation protein AF n=1 Tax=Bacillus TaxID=1386 RepID=UPI000403D51C|nr:MULTISPECIES: stage III sporulation protein AF [Bacillus]KAA0836488.1 stage III sporulation protein AF [Bacillus paralicheniformis]KAA0843586.1 stage III sporulation protein AF [Bacillus paralicheniformis]MBU8581722.1 stage III sporulation protein AF [Bacillus paralicheniformis]MCJ8222711.1 stage III sporulation protein AF [Bacillus paralicheniformis]MCU4669058.1 stage III sporulation protein AF [Bacillus paralicheniformis]
MEFLTEWLTNIILFILMAIVIDMLLPNSSMQKYAKMVISLLLIVVILNPIFSLFRTDPDVIFERLTKNGQVQSNEIKNQLNSEKKEIQASQQAYILEQMAVQLKKSAEGRFTSDKYKIDRVAVSSDGQLKTEKDLSKHAEVSVFMEPASEKTVQAVAPVEINTDRGYQPMREREKKETGEVREQLAGIWEISPDKITVHIEGGERSGNE